MSAAVELLIEITAQFIYISLFPILLNQLHENIASSDSGVSLGSVKSRSPWLGGQLPM